MKEREITTISSDTRAILFICKFQRNPLSMKIVDYVEFVNQMDALNMYANTPNPESQLINGSDINDLRGKVLELVANMKNEEWLKELGDML